MVYPFSAVHGMDDAKRALLCAAVNDRIRTVLIRGEAGTAKTVLSRSMGDLVGKRLVNIPVNVTEDQLFGGMDIESTIKEGHPVVRKGLLHSADGAVVYVDDVNLMNQSLLIQLLDCISSGHVVLEREGISSKYSFDTVLIASMDPSDSDLSSHVLDRFDLCAYTVSCDGDREEILRRNCRFNDDPKAFREAYSEQQEDTLSNIGRARRIMPLVSISDDLLAVASELVARVSADGMRGDIALVNVAYSLAALNGRDVVTRKDVEEAAMITLAHRRNYSQEPQQDDGDDRDPGEDDDGRSDDDPPEKDRDQHDDGKDPGDNRGESQSNQSEQQDQDRSDNEPRQDLSQMLEEMMFEIGEQFRVIDYLPEDRRKTARAASHMGRRMMVESSDSSGRYVRSRIPDGFVRDIAFDATVRAAAPYQRIRDHGDMSISIEKQDIRQKVRERRAGCTILFLVDASGSLGVRKRMSAVKGAVLSMLRDSYVKRDRIGMMAFRRDSAELILPPTKSIEYSYRKLEELPTGGKTPLGDALITISDFMTSYMRSHKGESCYVVLITDGRANVPVVPGSDANEEAERLASEISIPQLEWIIVDASAGYVRFDNAQRLAERLEGTYLRLEDLNADRLVETVRAAIRR